MRVGILSGSDFSVTGGAERLIIDLARALGAEVVVPTFREGVVSHFDPERRIPFISLDYPLPAEPLHQIEGMRLFRKASLEYDFVICIDDMAVRYLIHCVPHLYYMLTPRRALYDMYYHSWQDKAWLEKQRSYPDLHLPGTLTGGSSESTSRTSLAYLIQSGIVSRKFI